MCYDLSDYTIAVVRVGKDGTIKNSRPCNHCLATMCRYRIKRVVYSGENGLIHNERPDLMDRVHESSGWSAFENPDRLS